MKIFKVYVCTEGHQHLSEMIVAARSKDETKERTFLSEIGD